MSATDTNNTAAVVLLASDGPARERLRQAVGNAGGTIVLQADPARVDAAQVLGCHPAAVVIALDSGNEDVLDALEPVLAEAGVTVLLEEADMAASRQGWDAQRWERHLAAKLLGHGNVLPPGAEDDSGLQPEPGLPPTPAQLHAGAPIQPHLAQAMELADALPATSLGPDAAGQAAADGLVPALEAGAAQELGHGLALDADLPAASDAPAAADTGSPWQLPALDAYDLDDGPAYQPPAVTEAVPDLDQLLAAAAPLDPAADPAAGDHAAPAAPAAAVVPPPLPPELPPLDPPAGMPAAAAAVPAPAPAPSQWALVDFDAEPAAVAAPPAPVAAPAPPAWDLSGLSLLDENEGDVAAAPGAGVRTVALVMAGIGGPDAIRRLLATLPAEGMPGAVLVQLRLDGGRYANLVTQLERVCAAPVKLAAVGDPVEAGHVYVLADDITLGGDGGLKFAELPAMASVLADMPADGCAVLMLSGADAGQVDAVLDLGTRGAWVAGQSGEGCYDPAAASALAVAGMPVGEPAWLGRELLARWGL